MVPQGALDQLSHALSRIIHAFAKAEEDAKIFMAKWGIKDGFWQMDCKVGEEFNFAYVLPPDGVGGIPTIFLCSYGNHKGYCIGLKHHTH
jgi:hypothetical protein